MLCSKHIVITDAIFNLQWAGLPVVIHSICTPDDAWDCHPKHVELTIAKNKNAIVASCWTYLLLCVFVGEWTLNELKYIVTPFGFTRYFLNNWVNSSCMITDISSLHKWLANSTHLPSRSSWTRTVSSASAHTSQRTEHKF